MQNNKLFVGNLPYSATEDEMKEAFAQSGNVVSVKIIMDRATGRSKGFGFVEMATDAEAQAAIERLNGADYAGRAITVGVAKPQEPRAPGSGGGFRGDRGGRGGGFRGDRGGRGGPRQG